MLTSMLSPTMSEARRAHAFIRRTLDRPAWGRGVGFTLARDTLAPPGAPCVNAIVVNVRRPEDRERARQMLGGDEVLGVPVVYHAVGDIVAQAGAELAVAPAYETADKALARQVRDEIRRRLDRPPWIRGIGLGYTPRGYNVGIMVQKPRHISIARGIVGGDELWGVPIVYEAVGDFTPAKPPTEPPPSGVPEGHIGGSYDWWWWNIGRGAGMPYDPPDPKETEHRWVEDAIRALDERLGLAGGRRMPWWLAGVGDWRGPDDRLGVKVNVTTLTPEVIETLRGALDATNPPTLLGMTLWVQPVGTLQALRLQ